MTTDSNPAALAQITEQLAALRSENRALRAALEHQQAEARILQLWHRDDARQITQLEDLADQLAALLHTHGHTPETTPILALLRTYKQPTDQPC